MIIKDKIAIVYDVEVFPNLFTITLKNTETKQLVQLEVSDRNNQINTIIGTFLDKRFIFVGYNNIHYDNPIINYILKYKKELSDTSVKEITERIKNISDIILNGNLEFWKEYKYANNFNTLDLLTMLFSSKLRVSLKEMEVTLKMPNVDEYQGDFEANVPLNEIDEVLIYNKHDVEATEELLYRCEKDIELRLGIEQEYGVDVLSKDGMSIGIEILKLKYLEATNKSWYEIKDLRTPCDIIDLNEVIFDNVHFKTKMLQDLLKEMKQQKISPDRKGYEKIIGLQDMKVLVSVGGIHGDNGCRSIIPNQNQRLFDSDVALTQWCN